MNPTETYRAWVEVSFQALHDNLGFIRERVGQRAKILAVVKADAYGHGLPQIAGALMHGGVDIFGVANISEAMGIRTVGAGWPILMLSSSLPAEVEMTVRNNVMPSISSVEEAQWFQREAARQGKTLPVHIKLDTGMGRLGFWHEEAVEPIRKIGAMPNLKLQGIYTHFPSAEDDVPFSLKQVERFRSVVKDLGLRIPLRHADNSAALVNLHENRKEPSAPFNVVRPGLIMYGIVPPGLPPMPRLSPTLAFKSRVSFIKQVAPGRSISYGRAYVAEKPMRVAVVAVGYGDGFSRDLSNRGEVLIRGKRCHILGRVTMDQTMVDVSDPALHDLGVGEEVVLVGQQGTEEISVTQIATWAGTIPWEVMTSITKRVPRVYLGAAS